MTDPATPQKDAWTVRRVLDWTKTHLASRGSESPRLDAEILLAHAMQCQRILLYTRFDEELPEDVRARMRSLVQRRAQSEPVAYLVGQREFFGRPFDVDSSVLIPRPETETLVAEGLRRLEQTPSPRVLDIGTGSGCIAVTVAAQRSDARVTAIDVSEQALEVARRNAERHGVLDRIEFLHGNVYAPLGDTPFDMILSNPPYVTSDEMKTLMPDVRDHEPHTALDGGADGLDVAREIIAGAADRLSTSGWLLIELDPAQIEAAEGLMAATGRFEEITSLRDMSGDARVVAGQRLQ